ncbi:hypothetical protein LTR78_006697 [Recurvomyces mirabilis]|uniref:Uncharacterized protein n=1 Tax=Recurvomyces mirabilis TaxID=574656 RepID=A0AAE1BZQ7_9PEZI|nr:hypothetical protein LTR78_006697 [Recurvomyces mirabilis]KAK5151413.1 hypothetical protein LTS14_009256 [Recurvomyces mirabilis]
MATSSSAGVGDYIALGLGVSSTTPSTTSTSTTYSRTSMNTSSSTSQNATRTASATLGNFTSLSNTTLSNTTLGVCYDQWMSYWNSSSSYGGNSTVTIFPTYTTTTWSGLTTETDAYTVTGGTFTTTYDLTQIMTISAGAFNYSVITETYSGVQTYTVTASSTATTQTWTDYSDVESTATVPQVMTITPPPCALPGLVPQCQSSWMSFLSASTNYNPPVCQNANIDSDLCQSFQDKYVVDNKWLDSAQFDGYSKGVINGTAAASGVQEWIWPTWSTLAPSCTLGCARCGITGGVVQLMYWPPNTSYNTDAGPITVSIDDTTLTYPTVYVSYHEVSASDSCKAVGPTISNTIVAITNSADISSIYAQPDDGAQFDIVAFDVVRTEVASFNLADLQDTPASVFSRQIWCVSLMSMHAAGYENGEYYTVGDNGGLGAHIPVQYSCPTTLPYNPILYLPANVLQSMNPDWATCSGDINGVYDPPTALQPQATEDGVTSPKALTTTPASPSSPVQAPTVSATQTIITAQATNSAQPVVIGSSPALAQTQASLSVQSGPSGSSVSDPQQSSASTVSHEQSGGGSAQDPSSPQSSNNVDPGVLISIVSQVGGSPVSSGPPTATPSTNALSVLQSAADPTATAAQAGGNGVLSGQASSNTAAGNPNLGTSNAGNGQPKTISVGSKAVSAVNVDPSHLVLQGSSTSVTLTVGGAAMTIDGHAISAASSGKLIMSGAPGQSTIVLFPAAPNGPAATSVTAGGQVYAASSLDASHVVVQNSGASITLAAGGPATTMNGQVLSAASSGRLVIGGSAGLSTITVSAALSPGLTAVATAQDGHVLSLVASSGIVYVQEDKTTFYLAAGHTTVIDGQTIGAGPGASQAVIDGTQTIKLTSQTNNSPTHLSAAAAIKAGNGAILNVAMLQSGVEVWDGSMTVLLTPGAATVVDGQIISVDRSSSGVVVIGSSTMRLETGSVTQTGPSGSTTNIASSIGVAASNGVNGSKTPATSTRASSAAGRQTIDEFMLVLSLALAFLVLII